MELNNPRASFMPIPIVPRQIGNHDLLEQQCKRIISSLQPVDICNMEPQFANTPYFIRLFFSLYYTLTFRIQTHELPTQEGAYNIAPFNLNIKYPLFKLLASIIQKKLFLSQQFQKYYEEVSYSLAFKPALVPFLIATLSEHANFVSLERLTSFYRTIASEQHLLYTPIQLYYLYGGSLFTIEAKLFKQKTVALIEAVGKALSNSQTMVNRNIQHFKNNKERKFILQQSLRVVLMAKNKQILSQIITNISSNIFGPRQYLSKEQFLFQLQSKPLDPLLTLFILLLRSEYVMFEERVFQTSLLTRNETVQSNFYATEMTKLLNKCPFNGDERCSCKKCQCVRRNRESAKLNQEKKRNAVEQVDGLKRQVEELEEKERRHQREINQLKEENMMLKSLLKEIKLNPSMKSILMETIEPINKVLNNEL